MRPSSSLAQIDAYQPPYAPARAHSPAPPPPPPRESSYDESAHLRRNSYTPHPPPPAGFPASGADPVDDLLRPLSSMNFAQPSAPSPASQHYAPTTAPSAYYAQPPSAYYPASPAPVAPTPPPHPASAPPGPGGYHDTPAHQAYGHAPPPWQQQPQHQQPPPPPPSQQPQQHELRAPSPAPQPQRPHSAQGGGYHALPSIPSQTQMQHGHSMQGSYSTSTVNAQ
jgi:hypothetical protein